MNKLALNSLTQKFVDNIIKSSSSKAIGLVGSEGTGKFFVAEKITNSILGRKFLNSNYLFIDGKNEGIDEVRAVQKKLNLTTTGLKNIRRVLVINYTDELSREAQNSLLKTLEEPPLDTLILVCITNINSILATIKSRIDIINIRPISLQEAKNYYTGFKKEEIEKNYQISGGKARFLDELMKANQDSKILQNIAYAKDILTKNRLQRLGMVDSLTKNKTYSVTEVLDSLIVIFEATFQSSISKNLTSSELAKKHRYLNLTDEARNDLSHGCSPKLVLTRLFWSL